MATSDDLINFDVIEGQKENIQALPSGRSARSLAKLFSPSHSPLDRLATPTPSDTQNLNDIARREFEEEIEHIDESDDPLDIFDRYVKWTLDAYPTAQATPQSQLLPLLERATKTFLSSNQYKNDPRYLKLWLTYIRFFSDSPRETYAFLARHGVGDGLALFYEEFAAWLEQAGRWSQAEEVYQLGIEREARPAPRLVRKFKEFQHRFEQRPDEANEPSSPAIPTVRPALAAKIDPFAVSGRSESQTQQPQQQPTKPSKKKMAIFNDADEPAPAMPTPDGAKGWQNIGSLADRKKENMMEPKPWAGETLKAGGKKSSTKLAIFKDESRGLPASLNPQVIVPSKEQVSVNQRNGRRERVFVNLEAIYHSPTIAGSEFSFEELMGLHRGWLGKTWEPETHKQQHAKPHIDTCADITLSNGLEPMQRISRPQQAEETVQFDENGQAKERHGRGRKMKLMELNETQIIKTKLSSPSSGPRVKRAKISSEPTMTVHTRAATDEIYSIFSQPLKSQAEIEEEQVEEEEEDDDDEDEDDDDDVSESDSEASESDSDNDNDTEADYTIGAEGTITTQLLGTSEAEEDDVEDDESDTKSEWSDFTAPKNIPDVSDDTRTTHTSEHQSDEEEDEQEHEEDGELEEASTPVSPEPPKRTMFIPIPPEDYEAPTRPYRDPYQVAQNRLPFMTPIAERTESSIAVSTAHGSEGYSNFKTPSKQNGEVPIIEEEEDEEETTAMLSSPFQELFKSPADGKIPQLNLGQAKKSPSPSKAEDFPQLHSPGEPIQSDELLQETSPVKPALAHKPKPIMIKEVQRGPIIKELQCNPVTDEVRNIILGGMQPPLSTYEGFFEHSNQKLGRGAEIRKYVKAVKAGKGDVSPVLELVGSHCTYAIKRELGAGSFAPVYLVENVAESEGNEDEISEMGKGVYDSLNRKRLEAIKMEDPPTPWEFYITRQAKRRLGVSRASESILNVYEMHMYQDEGYLVEEYRDQGTLLDLINLARSESVNVMDEALAMFFTIELMRVVEALHAKGIMHGDLKADNALVRFDPPPAGTSWSSRYTRDGSDGWSSKGVTLIDFGRGIDMNCFEKGVQFIADWKPEAQDPPEMKECRPWTYQIDYYGLAGTIHSLLFGKYIEIVTVPLASLKSSSTSPEDGDSTLGMPAPGAGLGTRRNGYKIKEPLKRYWQTELWNEAFTLLLNPSEAAEGMPCVKSLKTVREKMESWLEANCEKGAGLQAGMRKLEGLLTKRR